MAIHPRTVDTKTETYRVYHPAPVPGTMSSEPFTIRDNYVTIELSGYTPAQVKLFKGPKTTGPWTELTLAFDPSTNSVDLDLDEESYYRVDYTTLVTDATLIFVYGKEQNNAGNTTIAKVAGLQAVLNSLQAADTQERTDRQAADNAIRGGATNAGDTLKKLEDRINALGAGGGTVKSVNGQNPDGAGAVTLTAANVGAATPAQVSAGDTALVGGASAAGNTLKKLEDLITAANAAWAAADTAQTTALRGGVPTDGDTLKKLNDKIIALPAKVNEVSPTSGNIDLNAIEHWPKAVAPQRDMAQYKYYNVTAAGTHNLLVTDGPQQYFDLRANTVFALPALPALTQANSPTAKPTQPVTKIRLVLVRKDAASTSVTFTGNARHHVPQLTPAIWASLPVDGGAITVELTYYEQGSIWFINWDADVHLQAQIDKNRNFNYVPAAHTGNLYTENEGMFHDPGGIGEYTPFIRKNSSALPDANLGTIWDPAKTAATQGTGTGNGPVYIRQTPDVQINRYGYSGQSDWTKAFNDALEDLGTNKLRETLKLRGSTSVYEVGNLNAIPNATKGNVRIIGDGKRNSIIRHTGNSSLFLLGDAQATTSANQNTDTFSLEELGIIAANATGTTAVGLQWRFPYAHLRRVHIEGFEYGVRPIVGTLAPTGTHTEAKSWGLVLDQCKLMYNKFGVVNRDHALMLLKTRIMFGDVGLLLDDTVNSSGAAISLLAADIEAQSVACVHIKNTRVSGFTSEGCYYENGYNQTFTGVNALVPASAKAVTPAPIFKIEDSALNAFHIRGGTMSHRAHPNAVEVTTSAANSRHLSDFSIDGVHLNKDSNNTGHVLSITGAVANSAFENIRMRNYMSAGLYAGICNDMARVDQVQESPTNLAWKTATAFYLTEEFKSWAKGTGSAAPVEPKTVITGGIQTTQLEDAQSGGNSEYTLADTNTGDAHVRFKAKINGVSGAWRLNRRSTAGTSMISVSHNNGNINVSGSSGTLPEVVESAIEGGYLQAVVRFPGRSDNQNWDIRPRTSGVGTLQFAEFELYDAPMAKTALVVPGPNHAPDNGAFVNRSIVNRYERNANAAPFRSNSLSSYLVGRNGHDTAAAVEAGRFHYDSSTNGGALTANNALAEEFATAMGLTGNEGRFMQTWCVARTTLGAGTIGTAHATDHYDIVDTARMSFVGSRGQFSYGVWVKPVGGDLYIQAFDDDRRAFLNGAEVKRGAGDGNTDFHKITDGTVAHIAFWARAVEDGFRSDAFVIKGKSATQVHWANPVFVPDIVQIKPGAGPVTSLPGIV